MDRNENEKKLAALKSLDFVDSGMTIGLGTGSTAYYFIHGLADKTKSGALKNIKCVSTSSKTTQLAKTLGLELLDLEEVAEIDLSVDGADEFDADLNLIKGGGGALLREKIVASISKKFIIIADSGKQVKTLGKFKLPVEVLQFAHSILLHKFNKLGYDPSLRRNPDGSVFISDNANYILDLSLKKITDPYALSTQLDGIPGVIGHGLFLGYAHRVLMGKGEKVVAFLRNT